MNIDNNKPICLLSGPFLSRSGYGGWATEIAKSVIKYNKFNVILQPTRWGNCPSKRFIEDISDPEERELVNHFLQQPLTKQPELFIQVTIPEEFQPVGKYNIGMTAGIESTLCDGSWIEGVNRMNMTIALSNHAKKVFHDTKLIKQHENGQKENIEVKTPIEVCNWGANTNIYKKTDEKNINVEISLDKVVEKSAFLFVGQWTHGGLYNDRKDIGNLIKTFCNAFKNSPVNDRPCLIVKTSGANYSMPDRFDMLKKINTIRTSVGSNSPNVYLLHGELTDIEMNALLNHEKIIAHVSFCHGEGYGHPMLLSTLSGKPLLAPNWSGHLDFLNPKYANLLPGNLVDVDRKSVNKYLIKESKWFKVSYSLAEDKLKQVYFARNSNKFKDNAELLRLENSQKFNINAMNTRLFEILDKYVPSFNTTSQILSLPKLKAVGNNTPSQETRINLPRLKMI